MKNVQIVFNIQVPEHVSEQEVSARLHQAIGSILDQEFGSADDTKNSLTSYINALDTQIGHA